MIRQVAAFVSAKTHDAGSGVNNNGMVVYSYVSKDGKIAIYSAHVDAYSQPHTSLFNATFSFLKLLHPSKSSASSDTTTTTTSTLDTSSTNTKSTTDGYDTNTGEGGSTKGLMDC